MLDNDCKYSKPFIAAIEKANIKAQRTALRSPNTVAYIERWVQTIQQEALDPFVVFGRQHMDVICSEFVEHYLMERPHQGLDNDLIQKQSQERSISDANADTIRLSDIRCKERLGGLLKSYSRSSDIDWRAIVKQLEGTSAAMVVKAAEDAAKAAVLEGKKQVAGKHLTAAIAEQQRANQCYKRL